MASCAFLPAPNAVRSRPFLSLTQRLRAVTGCLPSGAQCRNYFAVLRLMRVPEWETRTMDSIIYLVGLVVVIMFVLSLLGLR